MLVTAHWGLVACQTAPNLGSAQSFNEAQILIATRQPSLRQFSSQGPLSFAVHRDFKIPLSMSESVLTDFYRPKQKTKAPLLIIQHGNLSGKAYHEQQARLAASWGLNVLTVEQPNKGRWIKNGQNLYSLVELLHHSPRLLDNSFAVDQIVLAGHSFGGSATIIAAGSGASLLGIILLDPAVVHRKVEDYISKVEVPTILLGADKKVFKSRKRQLFFRRMRANILEFSFAGATHNDAQYPNMFSWKQSLGLVPRTDHERQKKFSAAIIASVYSLVKNEPKTAQKYLLQALKATTIKVKDIQYK